MRTLVIAVLCLGSILCGARVRIQAARIDAVRLSGGYNVNHGRVEILTGGRWGTVCDDGFEGRDAAVVCRMAGQPFDVVDVFYDGHFGVSGLPILLDDVTCTGDEPDLNECTHLPIGETDCFDFEEVGVACGSIVIDNIRLVNGRTPQEGRLEVHMGGQWGTVCDDRFDAHAAQVACRMLNFTTVDAAAVGSEFFGGLDGGPIILDDVYCKGNESSLVDCYHHGLGVNDCSPLGFQDVGVVCGGLRIENIRLVNGSHPREGRLEVQVAGRWGTVCDDGFHRRTAQVACRMLNFPTENAAMVYSLRSGFGVGNGLILMGDVMCTGDESSLDDCDYTGFALYKCDHFEDLGVICA